VRRRRVAVRVVTLSLVLAAVLEVLLLCVEAAVDGFGSFGGAIAFAADLVEKVPWSLFVCTGVWLGLQLGGGRPPLSLVGLVAAPVGSLLLRAVAEGAHAFAFAAAPAGPSPLLVAAIKGVEYACLGFMVGWLGQRSWAALRHHAAVGLAVAVPFGGSLLAVTAAASPQPLGAGQVGAWAVNELLFPIGCALVLYSAGRAEREELADVKTRPPLSAEGRVE